MMNFPQVSGPAMPKKKKTGIGGAIARVLDKARSAGRPSIDGMVPGAPKNRTLEVADDEKPTFTPTQRESARAKGAARGPINQRTRTYSFGRRRRGGT